MAFSKIILNGTTLMDVTQDTVTAGSLKTGTTATAADGTKVVGAIAVYQGDYEVIPDFTEQVLSTKDKTMNDDVTVMPIPVSRTTNASGGNTVYIGGIIDG